MPKYMVHAEQWVLELAEMEVEADNEDDAKEVAEDQGDWEWSDGDDSKDFEMTKVVLVTDDPDEELRNDLDDEDEEEDPKE